MEYKKSCFVFWWPITLYFNTMFVCFCGALVVNKLFQFYVGVFFLSWYHHHNEKTLESLKGAAHLSDYSCGFFLKDKHPPNVRLYSERASMCLCQTKENPVKSFYSLIYCCLVIIWEFVSIQLDCLSEQMQRAIYTMIWLSGPMSCQP